MRHENRYQVICEMLQAYDKATGNQGADHVIKYPHDWLNCHWQPFYTCAAELLIEAMEGMNTKTVSDRTIVAALKRIIKNSPDKLRGVFESTDAVGSTKYTLCDGYRILRLDSDYSSLERANMDKPPFAPGQITRMIDGDDGLSRSGEELNLPTIAEVKAFIAEKKTKYGSKNRIPMLIDDFIYVNPHYLLDFLQALPGCKAYKPEKNIRPIYFIADNGDGILLPVNPASAQAEAA